LNHYDRARERFYQLALTRFGGGSTLAKLGEGGCSGVGIRAVIEDAIQQCGSKEEVSQLSRLVSDSETNTMLAEQAATCPMDNAEMLEECFSVDIEKNDDGMIVLTVIPVQLEGYSPQNRIRICLTVYQEILSLGVDDVYCLSVNDPFVMR
jgi:hypothetical protein